MSKEENSFNYAYSASSQEEINNIRKKYLPKEEDKMEKLRKLDQSTTVPGTVASLIIGIISLIIFGAGLSCCLVWTDTLLIFGIILGVVGIIGMFCAYPVYVVLTKRQREKVAPEILKLTEELMK